jgi:imidazolonepropionase-like amidohydrolase
MSGPRKLALAVMCMLTLSAPLHAQKASEPFDRTTVLNGITTSDDVQRIPLPGDAAKGTIVLTGGRLIDGTGSPARPATIVITGKIITAILKPGEQNWPADARIYGLAGKSVMPGLIDLHTHLDSSDDMNPLVISNMSEATLRGLKNMDIFLHSGITSVRDVGSSSFIFSLKRWQANGHISGPRIFAAGQFITAPGGHSMEGTDPTQPNSDGNGGRIVSGADAWREAVRIQFARGADLIKLGSHYSQSEIDAAVDEAHNLGLPVTVDAETHFIDMALKAGVDSIEHPLPRSDLAIANMARLKIASVPTIVPYRYIMRHWGGYHGSTSRRFQLNEDTVMAMLMKLKRANVKLGIGTDMVGDWMKYMPHAYIDEMQTFAKIGYSNLEVLKIATLTNAEILKMEDKLGSVEVGKLADIIVIDGRPDEKLEDVGKVTHVFVNGRLQIENGRKTVTPHEPIQPPLGNVVK